MALIDISLRIRPDMVVYEGDPGVQITPYKQLDRGDPANVCVLSMGSHTGTHLDAPAHFLGGGAATIEQLSLDVLVGPALVVDIGADRLIGRRDLEPVALDGHTRVILKTRNSELWARGVFARDYVALELDAAHYLVARGVRLIGIDYLSIERFNSPDHAVHRYLLGEGVVILEGLALDRVEPGVFELICLPLPLAGIDGAPCRAVLRR